jgi:hypothetical protein
VPPRATAGGPPYNRSVFINCPFDEPYRPLFRAIVFCVQYCGYAPRCALDMDDSGQTRAGRIIDLIRGSRYGIHDLSRTELSGDLPRFNMPFEFGVFVGIKFSDSPRQRRKRALVLDRERYRYQKLMSDIAGQDIKAHNDDPRDLIREVRHWLMGQSSRELPGAEHICARYETFVGQTPALLAAMKKTEVDLANFADYRNLVFNWVRENEPSA